MSENDAYDVTPESEEYQDADGLEDTIYEQDQARKMAEQAELRALCIENGDNAEKFIKSSFGQYLTGQAALEADQAIEALTSVEPEDVKTIRKLQERIRRSRSLENWILDAIEQGNAEYIEYIQAQQAGEG